VRLSPVSLVCSTNPGIGSIVHLIKTKDGDYDLACALDFDGVGMYDTCVSASSVSCIANIPFTFMTPLDGFSAMLAAAQPKKSGPMCL
jgi:hypothetical protein